MWLETENKQVRKSIINEQKKESNILEQVTE